MKRAVIGGFFATLMATTVAMAGPPRWDDSRRDTDNQMIKSSEPFQVTCNTGGAASLLVGVAALGLILRRRR